MLQGHVRYLLCIGTRTRVKLFRSWSWRTCGDSKSLAQAEEVSSGSRRWLRSTMQSRRMSHDSSPSSRHRLAYLLPSRIHTCRAFGK